MHGTINSNQVPELVHRKVRHLPIDETLHGSNMRVRRYEVEEDAVFNREVITVGVMLPVIVFDLTPRFELNQPVDHLRAYPDGEPSGLLAVVNMVVLGDQDVLPSALGNGDAPWDWRPVDRAMGRDQLRRTATKK